ncbi:hypothetical protein PsYK624_074420 [Phanerochaete sordida]|uniref:Uncharacterized protein n=1 Tax=Phanerochaete sordida TaxID=48140 RepID=A0A9P3G8G7_9APHY|nr:hypothetical protein PsYK624_074420 [Phanerochaete sordida]
MLMNHRIGAASWCWPFTGNPLLALTHDAVGGRFSYPEAFRSLTSMLEGYPLSIAVCRLSQEIRR